MAADVIDVAALDASASAVETDSAVPELDASVVDSETPAEVPAVDTDSAADKTEDGKPVEKSAGDITTAALTPAKIIEALQKLKTEDPVMAKAIYSRVKAGSEAQALLRELAPGAETTAEIREALSNRVPSDVQSTLDAVNATDKLLYEGGAAHTELVSNIIEDFNFPIRMARISPLRASR